MHSFACPERATGGSRRRWEVADILHLHAEEYCRRHPLPTSHLKVMRQIQTCRTARLGGHLERCDTCGHERPAYNSCRNRHCPKCQTMAKEQWLQDRKQELLPVPYFHAVFTLPHELNPLALSNKTTLFKILFRSVAETLRDFAKDPRWKLEGQLGFVAVLHTWTQTLLDHFHVHCLIPAGVLSFNRQRWVHANKGILFHVKPLSRTFRGKFLFYLANAYENKKLRFPGKTASLASPIAFRQLLDQLYSKDWCVYAKKPLPGPAQVLEYLARYTHRVAISNHRIRSVENGQVTFSYKDRSESDRTKEMTLPADEFIRRFLLHVLPDGFMRIRHFGFLANVSKKQAVSVIRQYLGQSLQPPQRTSLSVQDRMLRLTGIDITGCPQCRSGTMRVIGKLPTFRAGHDPPHSHIAPCIS